MREVKGDRGGERGKGMQDGNVKWVKRGSE